MRDLRLQYVFAFGMLGTVLPYVSVYFRHAGLSAAQVGYAWAIWSAGLMLSPALVTMLADARIDPRRLLVLTLVVSGVSLLGLGYADGVGPVLGIWTAYCLASMPVLPLMDGIHFSQQRRRRERGEPLVAYPRVRVWGTIGYMVPSVLLFGFLQAGMSLRVVLMTGAAFAAAAAIQAFLLHDPRGSAPADADDAAAGRRGIPTLAAARILLRPNLLVFVAALVVLQAMGTIHGVFYPIYLTEKLGLAEKWLGQVSNLAVVIEIFFMVACGALLARFGVKRLVLVGIAATAVRLGLLAVTSNAWMAVGTQVFHGLLMVTVSVVPPMVLDEEADDAFRHSMQGLYVMLGGAGRALANLIAGPIAAWSLAGLYGIAAGMCAIACVMILVGFREPKARRAADAGSAERDTRDIPLAPVPVEAP